MGISFPRKSKLKSRCEEWQVRPRKSSCRVFLYRISGWAVILTVFSLTVLNDFAQEERPQIVPEKNRPTENKKLKKGKGPRAVGVLRFNGAGKVTLVPVAILIDGRFYDAGAYKANPVPMALETGTVYEAEEGGDSQGLFTVNGALHSKNAGSVNSWMGTGTFAPMGSETPKTTRKAEDRPVGLDSSGDEPPRLTRKSVSGAAPDDTSAARVPGESKSAEKTGGTGTPPSGKTEQDRQPSTNAPAGSGQAPSEKSSSPTSPPESSNKTSSGQTSSKSAEGYYRPTLRRGKPTEPAPQDEGGPTMTSGKSAPVGAASGSVPGAAERVVAAVSDAAGPEPQPYRFFWKTGEEEERRNQMIALAESEVRSYADIRAKGAISPKPAGKAPSRAGKATALKQPQAVLENVQFRAFDVWVTNQPVLILSAEAHIPPEPGAAASPAEPYSVTLVARTDIYGSLVKLYSGVTDKFHLDVTPRLELIDAVDADGDGRGELLFRETSDMGNGYLIYRATADKLWKIFDSLNAE